MGSIAKRIGRTFQVITAGDTSGDLTSDVVDIAAYRHLSIQASWTGTTDGNLQLQVSNDGLSWFDQGTPVATGGAPGVAMITEQFAPWAKMRLFFDRTSGTGLMNAFATTKE